MALGFTKKEIVNEFYEKENFIYDQKTKNGKQNLILKTIKRKNFS